MNNLDERVYGMILDKDFPIDKYSLEDINEFVMEVADIGDKKQDILGKLALEVYKRGGRKAVAYLSTNAGMPIKTLIGYMEVVQRLEGLEVPEDWSWHLKKLIAWAPDTKKTYQMAIDEGLTYSQLAIKLHKDKPSKTKKCKNGHEVDTKHCPFCKEDLT